MQTSDTQSTALNTARDVHADPVPQTASVATQTTRAAPAATGTKCDGLALVGQQANSTITSEVTRRLATSLAVMTPALVAAGDGAMLVHVNGMMEGLRARLSKLEDAAAVHASAPSAGGSQCRASQRAQDLVVAQDGSTPWHAAAVLDHGCMGEVPETTERGANQTARAAETSRARRRSSDRWPFPNYAPSDMDVSTIVFSDDSVSRKSTIVDSMVSVRGSLRRSSAGYWPLAAKQVFADATAAAGSGSGEEASNAPLALHESWTADASSRIEAWVLPHAAHRSQ
jgi:hypothetical protein